MGLPEAGFHQRSLCLETSVSILEGLELGRLTEVEHGVEQRQLLGVGLGNLTPSSA